MQKVFLLCFLGMLVQPICSQCISPGLPCQPILTSAVLGEGKLKVCSDDLIISGPIVVAGKLPFSGTVTLEGELPAAGAGIVNYCCGEPLEIRTETPIGTVAGFGFRS